MERPAAATLPAALAREVAEREGVKAVVAGQIDPVGRGYVLVGQPARGRRRPGAHGGARDPPRTEVRCSRPSTGSPRSCASGSASRSRRSGPTRRWSRSPPGRWRRFGSTPPRSGWRRATGSRRRFRCCEEAVALDSGFAMAWRKLAVVLGNTERSATPAVAAATRAYRHRDRLTGAGARSGDRLLPLLRGGRSGQGRRGAIGRCSTIDPDNLVALNNLSIVLRPAPVRGGRKPGRSRHADWAGVLVLLNTIQAQVAQGQQVEAQETLERYRRQAHPRAHTPELLQRWRAVAEGLRRRRNQRLLARRTRKDESRSSSASIARGTWPSCGAAGQDRGSAPHAPRAASQVAVGERLPASTSRQQRARLASWYAMYGRDPRAARPCSRPRLERIPLGLAGATRSTLCGR